MAQSLNHPISQFLNHPIHMTSELIETIQAQVRKHARVHVHGARTKTAMHVDQPSRDLAAGEGDVVDLDLRQLSGVLQYDAQEFVLTALAGTPVREVEAILAAQGQYLPFDPLFVEQGATLGGTVAANAGGPGRFRYGGVRDFLIGARFIDGTGQLIMGGGKVVKNAAGFDYPKLMVGSYGRLGVLVELTFKVFPKPEAYHTVLVPMGDLDGAIKAIHQLTTAPLDIEALDLVPSANGAPASGAPYILQIRIGGLPDALPARAQRLRQTLGGQGDILANADDAAFWRDIREMGWANGALSKLPLTPSRIAALEGQILAHAQPIPRRYSVGGNVAWLATDQPIANFESQAFLGNHRPTPRPPNAFAQRIKQALDPNNKF